jgi:hypothetical protein
MHWQQQVVKPVTITGKNHGRSGTFSSPSHPRFISIVFKFIKLMNLVIITFK